MVPGARQALRRIGRTNDVITFVSHYARRRISAALGPTAALEYLPPGVRVEHVPARSGRPAHRSGPDTGSGRRRCCCRCPGWSPRKGQDSLIRRCRRSCAAVPQAQGADRRRRSGRPATARVGRCAGSRRHGAPSPAGCPWSDLPAHYAAGDVFAMPCRTRGSGLDVEGLGIVFLEASASGLPVIAGRSGGAPETVQPGRTGTVVDGRDVAEVAAAAGGLLADRDRAAEWGANGRRWVSRDWNWDSSAERLADLLSGVSRRNTARPPVRTSTQKGDPRLDRWNRQPVTSLTRSARFRARSTLNYPN